MSYDFSGVGSNYSSDWFSSMFGGTNSTSSSNNFLGDYAAIKNGSYGKLLKSYYAEQKSAKNSSGTDEVEEKSATSEKKNLMLVKNDAEGLVKAASDLFNTKFDMKTESFDKDDVKKKIQSFIESYNKVVDSGAEVDTKPVLSKTLQLTQFTKENKAVLSKVGIKVGSDNKLSLDEKKFDSVNKSALNSVFNGRNSFISSVANKASQLFNLAGAATYEKVSASAYTKNGQYNSASAFSMFNAMF